MADKIPQAPPPAFLKQVVKTHREEPEITEDAAQLEQAMLDFSQSEAWKYLSNFINNKRRDLASDIRERSNGAASLEEIGFRYLAADQVNTFATQIISFVEKYARARETDRANRDSGDTKEN